jgi:hypothetical protein
LDHYIVQVSTEKSFSYPAFMIYDNNTGTTSQFLIPAALDPDTTYYWRVSARNASDISQGWSPVRSFRTVILPPVLVAPIGGAVVGSRKPVLDWNDVTGATSYKLQVSLNSAFSSLVLNLNVTPSTYTPLVNLAANKLFHWRVKALGPNGPSTWSAVETFHTP